MATNFVYYNPTKIYFGNEQMKKLGEVIRDDGIRKVLMVYGGGSIKKNGVYGEVTASLKAAGVDYAEFGGIEPNPKYESVNQAAERCRREKVDAVLSVGGGSTLDAVKAIAEATFYEGDCWDLLTEKASVEKALPIYAVSTLSAAGSENDAWAVVSNMETNEKVSPWKPHYAVRAAFINPEYMKTVSKYQTAVGSVDILSHVTDCRYFISEKKIPFVAEMMEAMARNVIKYAPIAYREPDNYEARESLAWISEMITGGIMDLGSSTSMVLHMMEHELSAFYDINHGHGIAILMPHWMEYILDESTAPALRRYGVQCLGVDPLLSDMDGAKAAIEAQKEWLFGQLELESKLSELGVDDKNIDRMAEAACAACGGVLKGIRDLGPEDVAAIYRASL